MGSGTIGSIAACGTYCAVPHVLAIRRAFAAGDIIAMRDVHQVVRFTRNWIHYGFLAHTVVCVLIAAAEGLMGR
jgi:hypothetical protein